MSVSQLPRRNTAQPENYRGARVRRTVAETPRYERTHEADNQTHDHAVPRGVRLEEVRVWERLAVEALQFEAAVEPDVRDADTEPCHKAGDGGHCANGIERHRTSQRVGVGDNTHC